MLVSKGSVKHFLCPNKMYLGQKLNIDYIFKKYALFIPFSPVPFYPSE